MKTSPPGITQKEERLVQAMQLLGDSTRYKMFKLLTENEEMCVSDIADTLGVSVSAISQHFRQFELVGLVNKERMGQKICYVLDDGEQLVKDLTAIVKQAA